MYSPALLPSSRRAAPAKKRRLSEQTGSSSRAYASGLPTLRDSISASSSVCSSIRSASFSRISARSPGVVSSHSGSAAFAASIAASTSSAPQRGTSAITSSVAGFSTSIVSPEAASVHAPPTRICVVTGASSVFCAENAGLARQALGEHDRDDRQQQDHEDDHVDLRQLLAEPDLPEDPDRQRVLGAGRERGDDHLVERKGKSKQ